MSRIPPVLAAIAGLALWPILGCEEPEELPSSDDDADDDGTGDDDTTYDGPFEPVVDWSLSPNPHNPFSAIVALESDRAMAVRAAYGVDGSYDRETPELDVVAATPAAFAILGLRADTGVDVRLAARSNGETWTSDSLSIHTDPLPDTWPECTVTAAGDPAALDADEVFCTNAGHASDSPLFCVDRTGTPVWSLIHPDDEVMNVFQPLASGGFAGMGRSDDFLALFDPFGELVDEYPSVWLEGKGRFWHDWLNEHEVMQIREGQWAGAVGFLTKTEDWPDGVSHHGTGIMVLDPLTEEVLWDWNSHGDRFDGEPIDPALVYHRYGLDYEGHAWHHANALIHGIEDDGREFFWISLRNQDWIIKVDAETDEVVWRFGRDGDFELVDDLDAADAEPLDPRLWAYRQHAPERVSSGGSRTRFLLFDNGEVRPGPDGEPDWTSPYSRVVEYEIDEDSMRATIHFDHGNQDPEDPAYFFSHIYGDADLLPDGQSLIFTKGTDGPFVAELAYPGGEELWRFQCSWGWYFYRARHFPSIYAMHD